MSDQNVKAAQKYLNAMFGGHKDWVKLDEDGKTGTAAVSYTHLDVYKRQVHKRSIDDARTYFARIGTDIVTHLAKLSSTACLLYTSGR